ncbi:hypothetical protein Q7C18_07465 [Nesterenkonia sp. CL21]|uniref:hypothetical protein n=1 Tax=Nesterenkonia sp. CL21 TaxID=3064894 RepID=UPI002878CC36|nr:hypothetical protein [Nesterenkonia sp. CL21]MDS2172527.1 hypothetical protein [Nesterenkonia sp. CL21]
MLVRFQDIEVGQVGGPRNVVIENFEPSYPEIRSSDAARESRDGVLPGRDYFGARTLGFDLVSNRHTMAAARESIAEFLTAWRDTKVRLVAGAMVPLEYRAVDDPRWRRVIGRPRRADEPTFDFQMRQGVGRFTVEFEVLQPQVYAGGEEGLNRVRFNQVADFTPGGWRWPRDPGWPVLGQTVTGTREGSITVTGTETTPAIVTFHGPGRRFSLDGNRGWHVGLDPEVTLAADEAITIDPLAGTVTDNFGRSRFGALDRRSGLYDVQLQPGSENVFFSADDVTLEAHAVLSWRSAYSTMV